MLSPIALAAVSSFRPYIYELRGIQDPEDECKWAFRAVEESVVPFDRNPFVGGGAVRELAARAQVEASNNPFLVAAQVFASKAAAPVDDLAIVLANMFLAK